jgi:hypothetical protein
LQATQERQVACNRPSLFPTTARSAVANPLRSFVFFELFES